MGGTFREEGQEVFRERSKEVENFRTSIPSWSNIRFHSHIKGNSDDTQKRIMESHSNKMPGLYVPSTKGDPALYRQALSSTPTSDGKEGQPGRGLLPNHPNLLKNGPPDRLKNEELWWCEPMVMSEISLQKCAHRKEHYERSPEAARTKAGKGQCNPWLL